MIYLANEGFRFQDPLVDGEYRRLQILTRERRVVPADQCDPEDPSRIFKDPRIKAESKQWVREYVWVLLCVARGCDIAQDDLLFPAPTYSKESVAELIEAAGPAPTWTPRLKLPSEFDTRLCAQWLLLLNNAPGLALRQPRRQVFGLAHPPHGLQRRFAKRGGRVSARQQRRGSSHACACASSSSRAPSSS